MGSTLFCVRQETARAQPPRRIGLERATRIADDRGSGEPDAGGRGAHPDPDTPRAETPIVVEKFVPLIDGLSARPSARPPAGDPAEGAA
jgi:hypothetical protein